MRACDSGGAAASSRAELRGGDSEEGRERLTNPMDVEVRAYLAGFEGDGGVVVNLAEERGCTTCEDGGERRLLCGGLIDKLG